MERTSRQCRCVYRAMGVVCSTRHDDDKKKTFNAVCWGDGCLSRATSYIFLCMCSVHCDRFIPPGHDSATVGWFPWQIFTFANANVTPRIVCAHNWDTWDDTSTPATMHKHRQMQFLSVTHTHHTTRYDTTHNGNDNDRHRLQYSPVFDFTSPECKFQINLAATNTNPYGKLAGMMRTMCLHDVWLRTLKNQLPNVFNSQPTAHAKLYMTSSSHSRFSLNRNANICSITWISYVPT